MEDSSHNTNKLGFKGLWQLIKTNIGDYFMFIALIVIMVFFTIKTDGNFISSRNISNLINQMGYIAVLAVGMTLVIVIRHIDLSVGYLAGFLGAFSAIAMTRWGWPVYAVVPAVLILGILATILFLPNSSPAFPHSPTAIAFAENLETIAEGQSVLLVLDYQAGSRNEIEPLLEKLLESLETKDISLRDVTANPENLWLSAKLFAGSPA